MYHYAGTLHASSHCFWHGESNAYTWSDEVYVTWGFVYMPSVGD